MASYHAKRMKAKATCQRLHQLMSHAEDIIKQPNIIVLLLLGS